MLCPTIFDIEKKFVVSLISATQYILLSIPGALFVQKNSNLKHHSYYFHNFSFCGAVTIINFNNIVCECICVICCQMILLISLIP